MEEGGEEKGGDEALVGVGDGGKGGGREESVRTRRMKNLTICPQLLLRVARERPFMKECMSSWVGK